MTRFSPHLAWELARRYHGGANFERGIAGAAKGPGKDLVDATFSRGWSNKYLRPCLESLVH